VAGVREDRAVLHRLEVLAAQDVLVAGRGAEDVADLGGLGHREHAEPVHDRLQGAHRVDLEHDDVGAHAARALGEPAAAPAVAADDEVAAGQQHVGRADDAVDRRLACAVAVVEEVLGLRLVDRDDGEGQDAVALHGAQADDAGRRLLGAGDDVRDALAAMGVQDADHVGPVVHRHLRARVHDGVDVLVVRVVVLVLDGEGRDPVLGHERGRHVVLGGERVGGAERDLGTTGGERPHEVRGLGRHVQARADTDAVQRLLGLEALPDGGQHRHLAIRPLDAAPALCGQAQIADVVIDGLRGHAVSFLSSIGRFNGSQAGRSGDASAS
jgi:hypothetical protein